MLTVSMKGLGDSNVVAAFNPYSFLSSTAGLDNTGFAVALFQSALGRYPGPNEVQAVIDNLNFGKSRYDMAQSMLTNQEYYQKVINSTTSQAGSNAVYLTTPGGTSGYTPTSVVSPSAPVQVAAAANTAASGDTTNTSSSTLTAITNMLSGSTSILGHNVPTYALALGAVAALYMFSKGRR